MKIRYIFSFVATALLFTNCMHEEIDVPMNVITVEATMEGELTKSTVSDKGEFLWAEGDNIAIHTANSTLFGKYASGAGTSSATFTYGSTESAPTLTGATYPYNSAHSFDGTYLTFAMPETYALGNNVSNTNAPMLAVLPQMQGQNTQATRFNFSHLGGVFCFTYVNVPAGANKFTLSLGNKKINGTFTATVGEGPVTIATDNTEKAGLTTLTFKPTTAGQTITLYVPVPTGEYEQMAATLYADDEVLDVKSGAAQNTVNRRTLVRMPAVTFNEVSGDIDNSVKTEAELREAVANGGVVTLTENITLGSAVLVTKDITLDFNGNTVTMDSPITVAEGATLNLVNNGQPVEVKSGDATVAGGIVSENDIIVAKASSTINIGEGVNLTTTGANTCVVWIPGNPNPGVAENVTLTTAGNLVCTQSKSAVVYHNGNLTSGTINITGGSITHNSDVAVYVAGVADVKITGNAVITGTTAIEQRAGKLTIDGGEFVATGNPFDVNDNGNGTTTVGSAVALSVHDGKTIEATINGGIFEGYKSLYVSEGVTLTVNGGTFSDPTPCYYLGDAANVTVNMTDSYEGPGFVVKAGQKVAMNMGSDVTYNVTNPLVGSAGTQTLGFQFLNGSNVSINGGKITSSDAKMLINNYTNLTLTDTELAPSIPNTMNGQTYYVLSNNSGEVNINGKASIKAPVKDGIKSYAFDVCKYASYEEPKVIWNSTGTVTGGIELSGGEFVVNQSLALTNPIKVVSAAKMTVNSKVSPAESWNAGDALVVVNRKGNLNVSGSGSIDAGNNSKVYAAVKMTELGEEGGEEYATLSVDGVTLKGYYYGITGNGNRSNTNIIVNSGNISSNCSNDGHAIYHPQSGKLTVNGGALSGYFSAIEHRGGELTITGGEFSSTYTPTTAEQNGSGTSIKGAAIAVSAHKGVSDISLSISGGTFTGHSALHEEYTEAGEYNATGTFAVTGGTFNGKVYSENYKDFITGGTFTDPSAFEYMGNNADVTVGKDMSLNKSIGVNKNVTIDLNDKTVECETSDVFVVTKGTLTLNGNGLVYGSKNNSSSACAVWAKEDGNVVINGGTYKVGHDGASKSKGSENWRNDCIYARDRATITINGGEFAYTGDVDATNYQSNGNMFLLNCRDADYKAGTSKIEVKGGKYYKYDPSGSQSENTHANFVVDGYKSVQEGDYYIVSAE